MPATCDDLSCLQMRFISLPNKRIKDLDRKKRQIGRETFPEFATLQAPVRCRLRVYFKMAHVMPNLIDDLII